ncbi:MAG: hypothetical protein GKR98_07375 [Boseongicola sp.]|nr:MAG: hypothetical protein GKR98_07375 [Boseongicola sp.]
MADAADVRDRIVAELQADGFTEIRISRTLLGRLRFVATSEDARREIVVNPSTGLILRDYLRILGASGSSGGSGSGSGTGGSGSGNESGGGGDDDGDDDDSDDSDDDDDDSRDDDETDD